MRPNKKKWSTAVNDRHVKDDGVFYVIIGIVYPNFGEVFFYVIVMHHKSLGIQFFISIKRGQHLHTV